MCSNRPANFARVTASDHETLAKSKKDDRAKRPREQNETGISAFVLPIFLRDVIYFYILVIPSLGCLEKTTRPVYGYSQTHRCDGTTGSHA